MTNNTTKYRIHNWAEYNRALEKRGSLTVWFEDAPAKWKAGKHTGQRGRPRIYSDEAILCALVLRSVYHLPLRALRGFLLWIFQTMSLMLPVPCYTRICRRAALIGQELAKLTKKRPTDIVFDSTGVKVYGEGEWKVRQHGKGKRRTWRKVHLAICPNSHEVIMSELTTNGKADADVANQMMLHLPKSVKTAYGDGAYDREAFRKAAYQQGISSTVPPRRGARLKNLEKKPWMTDRNDAIKVIGGLGKDDEARKIWKILIGYHTRSLAETAMCRFKKIFGGDFRSRKMQQQKAELYAKSIAMNKMTRLGVPKGRWI